MILQPLELLLAVLTKMTIQSLCRMRQTGKYLDTLVENNRFRINARSDVPRSLWIAMDAAYNCISCVVMSRYIYHFDGSFIYNPDILNYPEADNFCINITDPLKQLSGVRFQSVYMEWTSWLSSSTVIVLDIIQALRLKTEWLTVYNIPHDKMNIYRNAIQFKKLVVCHDNLSVTDLDIAHIQNCKQLVLRNISETLEDLSPFVQPFEEISIRLYGCQISLLSNFLMDVAKDRRNRGNLRLLRFHIDGFAARMNLGETSHIGFGDVFGYNFLDRRRVLELVHFYKMKIDGGFAYIVHKPQRLLSGYDMDNVWKYDQEFLELDFIVHFVELDDRATLFDVVFFNLFHNVPYDLSFTYEEFFAAETETDAFKILYKSYSTEERTRIDQVLHGINGR